MDRARLGLLALICAATMSLGGEGEGAEALDCREAVRWEDGHGSRLLCGGEAQATGLEAGTLRLGDGALARMEAEDLALLRVPVQVNRASAEELDTLPGIGPVLAARVIEGRPYEDAAALIDVKGIGPKKLAKLEASGRLAFSPAPNR